MVILPDIVLVSDDEQKMLSIIVWENDVIHVGRMICGNKEKEEIMSKKLVTLGIEVTFKRLTLKSPKRINVLFSSETFSRIGVRKSELKSLRDIQGCLYTHPTTTSLFLCRNSSSFGLYARTSRSGLQE